ncbi:hypothetical protein [Pelotomaculum propionicicum]|uniref:Uncharacterized protein n=1 Tax=Pelotomaculum propionicicum TaxID=258475 RepID=A0A4Y7RK11_9FIRM|nr:hypothetical protein [Pelotomaculum propionicicum]NLI12966.1 hypothetical protein [Peptococcaceae bacterium]TEB09338.1 hypothetical protein Pmgp_03208 [Pelotomaculum propionicicum]
MCYFICEKCGEKIYPIDGFLSWQREDGILANFQIAHRKYSDPQNNACVTLFEVVDEDGFMGFIKYLIDCWGDGLTLEGHESLLRVFTKMYEYRNQRLKDLLYANE